MAELAVYVEKEHLHAAVSLLDEHTRHGKGVAAVVTRSGEEHEPLARQKARDNLAAHHRGGTLHQVDGIYLLFLASGIVEFMNRLRI